MGVFHEKNAHLILAKPYTIIPIMCNNTLFHFS